MTTMSTACGKSNKDSPSTISPAIRSAIKIPTEIKDGIEVRPVTEVEEVLRVALNLTKPEEFMKVRALKVLDGEAGLEVAN